MKRLICLSGLCLLTCSAMSQQRIGNDSLYFELNSTGLFELHGPLERSLQSDPMAYHSQLNNLIAEVLYWVAETRPELKGITISDEDLEIRADIQPQLTPIHVPLIILGSDLKGCDTPTGDPCMWDILEEIKTELILRGMHESEFNHLVNILDQKLDHTYFDGHHPIRKEYNEMYHALKEASNVTDADREIYIELQRRLFYRTIGEDWAMAVFSELSKKGQRVLWSYLKERTHQGTLLFWIETGPINQQLLDEYRLIFP